MVKLEPFCCTVPNCAGTLSSGCVSGMCNAHNLRRRRYGLNAEELALVDAVTHCQACGIALADVAGKPAVDHDHEGGHVRGILCHACNLAEGVLRNREHAERLLAYVERTRNPNFEWAEDRRSWLLARNLRELAVD